MFMWITADLHEDLELETRLSPVLFHLSPEAWVCDKEVWMFLS